MTIRVESSSKLYDYDVTHVDWPNLRKVSDSIYTNNNIYTNILYLITT